MPVSMDAHTPTNDSKSRAAPRQHDNKNGSEDYSVLAPSAGISSRANRYAVAPQAKVTVNPNWMAMTMARTDPSTLAAAFMAHAHSTELSEALAPAGNSGAGSAARAR